MFQLSSAVQVQVKMNIHTLLSQVMRVDQPGFIETVLTDESAVISLVTQSVHTSQEDRQQLYSYWLLLAEQ